MSLRNKLISGAAALALAGSFAIGATGSPVNNPQPITIACDGTGDYLLAPVYYATNNTQAGQDWQTKIKVVNTNTTRAVVAKVVIRDGLNSDEIIDFPIYLTPGDVWEGVIKDQNGNIVVVSEDDSSIVKENSCMNPHIGSKANPVVYDNGVAIDAATWKGYVEIAGLASYDATTIDSGWNGGPLSKLDFFRYVRDDNNDGNPDCSDTLNSAGAEDVGPDDLMGKQTILAYSSDITSTRNMELNLFALENLAQTPRIDGVIGTNTIMGAANTPASITDATGTLNELDALLAKSHIYVMYEGDGNAIHPIRVHFTVPTKKYHYIASGNTLPAGMGYTYDGSGTQPSDWYYTVDTQTTIFRDMHENPNFCRPPSSGDVSGPREGCPVIEIPEEVHAFDGTGNTNSGLYIDQYAYAEGGYIDFDFTHINILGGNMVGMPIVPSTFHAEKFNTSSGPIYLNNHLYNQYKEGEEEELF